jgi:cytochrome oxidase Cu insertion factor (SCO1/SenC/PrrC family)
MCEDQHRQGNGVFAIPPQIPSPGWERARVRGIKIVALHVVTVCLLLLLAFVSSATAQLAAYNQVAPYKQPASHNPFVDIGLDQRLNEQLPLDLMFTDEKGKSVRLREYFGTKPVILSLAYFDCPMLCTLVVNGLIRTLRTLSFSAGNEFTVLTISFNPTDTAKMAAVKKQTSLQSYNRAGAEAGWHFLTGDEAAVQRLTQAIGFRYRYDAERKSMRTRVAFWC